MVNVFDRAIHVATQSQYACQGDKFPRLSWQDVRSEMIEERCQRAHSSPVRVVFAETRRTILSRVICVPVWITFPSTTSLLLRAKRCLNTLHFKSITKFSVVRTATIFPEFDITLLFEPVKHQQVPGFCCPVPSKFHVRAISARFWWLFIESQSPKHCVNVLYTVEDRSFLSVAWMSASQKIR